MEPASQAASQSMKAGIECRLYPETAHFVITSPLGRPVAPIHFATDTSAVFVKCNDDKNKEKTA